MKSDPNLDPLAPDNPSCRSLLVVLGLQLSVTSSDNELFIDK